MRRPKAKKGRATVCTSGPSSQAIPRLGVTVTIKDNTLSVVKSEVENSRRKSRQIRKELQFEDGDGWSEWAAEHHEWVFGKWN